MPTEQSNLFGEERHDPGGKIRIPVPNGWECRAEFSVDEKFRYKLLRRWSPKPLVLGVFMNPSTAEVRIDDPTVAKWEKMAMHQGFGGCMVGNVGAYRMTHPSELKTVQDPIGPRNHRAILEMAAKADRVIMAYGRLADHRLRISAITIVRMLLEAGHDLYALKLLDDGTPSHPLARGNFRIPINVEPILWRKAEHV